MDELYTSVIVWIFNFTKTTPVIL